MADCRGTRAILYFVPQRIFSQDVVECHVSLSLSGMSNRDILRGCKAISCFSRLRQGRRFLCCNVSVASTQEVTQILADVFFLAVSRSSARGLPSLFSRKTTGNVQIIFLNLHLNNPSHTGSWDLFFLPQFSDANYKKDERTNYFKNYA